MCDLIKFSPAPKRRERERERRRDNDRYFHARRSLTRRSLFRRVRAINFTVISRDICMRKLGCRRISIMPCTCKFSSRLHASMGPSFIVSYSFETDIHARAHVDFNRYTSIPCPIIRQHARNINTVYIDRLFGSLRIKYIAKEGWKVRSREKIDIICFQI